MTYKRIDWEGFEAHQIESRALKVVTIPQIGGKIVSLFDKRSNHEWLVSPRRPLRPAPGDSSFSDYDLSGWDEMFPTITACEFVDAEGTGTSLPDHGELWTQEWATTAVDDTSVTMRVSGIYQPYILERRMEITDADQLCLSYRLMSQAAHPFPFIWAAHPLFRAFPESRLSFTPVLSEMVLVSPLPQIGFQQGQKISLSVVSHETGEQIDILNVGQSALNHSRKLYLPQDVRLQSVRIEHPHRNTALDLSWAGDSVRYFGLWIDEGTHSSDYVLAPEPCSGYYDDLGQAHAHKTTSVIQPGEMLTWMLQLQFTHLPRENYENH